MNNHEARYYAEGYLEACANNIDTICDYLEAELADEFTVEDANDVSESAQHIINIYAHCVNGHTTEHIRDVIKGLNAMIAAKDNES